MTTLEEFRCEVCGPVITNPVHGFVTSMWKFRAYRRSVEFLSPRPVPGDSAKLFSTGDSRLPQYFLEGDGMTSGLFRKC
jgi:hypothetical protein